MKIDKKYGDVCFCESTHTYWNANDDAKYISVTTLIDRYVTPFDKEFWSMYKALEKLLGGDFKLEKRDLLKNKKITLAFINHIIEDYDISENEIFKARDIVLEEWKESNKVSCERGTKIHAGLENQYLLKTEHDLKKYGIGGKFTCKPNYDKLDLEKGIYPEYLIYLDSINNKLRLAGQIDLLIKDGNDIMIFDYKTNKKLDNESYFNPKLRKYQMMSYPLNNLMDCNKMHYALQLSTYAYMLQKRNPDLNIKKLMLIHYDHDGNVTNHELPYLKDEVVLMCRHYIEQKEIEYLEEKRKPIIF